MIVHTFHGHVLRGYFGRLKDGRFPFAGAVLAHWTTALIAVSPEVRDDLVRLGVAPAEKFVVIRLGIELEERVDAADPDARKCGASSVSMRTVSWSAGSAG